MPSSSASVVTRSSGQADQSWLSGMVVHFAAVAVIVGALMIAAPAFLEPWLGPAVAFLRSLTGIHASPAVFVAMFLVLSTAGVPAPILGAAAGVAFGPFAGSAVAFVALEATACAQFVFVRHLAGEGLRQRVSRKLGRVGRALERRGVIAVTAARLLPIPFSEFNYVAALTTLDLRAFTIGTFIGGIPKALLWAGVGTVLVEHIA